MNSLKKHYPEGAKIKKPASVLIFQIAAAFFAIPLLIEIVIKLISLVTSDQEKFISTIKLLGQGFGFSFGIFFFTIIFSLPLGLIVAAGKMSKIKTISAFFTVYVSVLRGTPLMLQLLLVYFGPYYLFGVTTGNIEIGPFNYRFIASIIGFSLNYAAYFAEIFRGGIQSMSKGQYEAAQVLGFSKMQTYFKIILPQVVKRVLPSVGNEVITLVKDTSLAQVLAVTEMFTQASALASAQVSVMPFIVAGLFYYLMNVIIETLLGLLEKKMNYYS
ncbi:MAG: amino acid ABC transporter permease [Clostridiales bacterium]|nr:amino acid ABC transporter permease [Clostridiales bacterium]